MNNSNDDEKILTENNEFESGCLLSDTLIIDDNSYEVLFNEFLLYKNTEELRKYQIRNQIAEKALRLVPYVTRSYAKFSKINIGELNSYGYEGLLHAIDNFDPNLGYKFSTFAVNCIIFYIKIGLREIRGIYTAKAFYSDLIKCKVEVENDYSEKAGVTVTIYDEPNMVKDIVELMIRKGMISKKHRESIENKINIIYHVSYEGQVEVISDFDLEEMFFQSDLKDIMNDVLETLNEREKGILRLRYGFDDNLCSTFEEIGKIYGVSRERVRQIENDALIKLRHPSRAKKLKDFYR